MHAPTHESSRAARLRRTSLALCVSLVVVACLASCSTTTRSGAQDASATPTVSRTGAARIGPIRVTFEVDTYPSTQGLPIPDAPDSAQGKALLRFVKQFDAKLPAGRRPIEARLISTADLVDSWASTTRQDCSTVLTTTPPDVFVPYQNQLTLDSLGCFLRAGTIVLIGTAAIVPSAWLERAPGVFLPRGTTYVRWASAVSEALDDGASPPPTRIVVMGPEKSLNMSTELAASAYKEVVTALQRPGRTVTLFNSPAYTQDIASSEAAFALVPTKLRRLGVDALVLPGVATDPVPSEAMVKQQFTPPAIAAPDGALAADGYRMDRLRSLPAPTRDLDETSAALRLRSELAGSERGKACLQTIEPDGRKVDPGILLMLTMQCDVLDLLSRAVEARVEALDSPQAFGAALTSLGSVSFADGAVATFGRQPQLGATRFVLAAGDARCDCLIPTEKSYSVTP